MRMCDMIANDPHINESEQRIVSPKWEYGLKCIKLPFTNYIYSMRMEQPEHLSSAMEQQNQEQHQQQQTTLLSNAIQ